MGEANWTFFNDGLDGATVDRGVTAGIFAPPGGGDFVFGFNSLAPAEGAVALFTNQVNFAPTGALKGGSVRGAIERAISGGELNFACFYIIGAQGPSVNDKAYILGLQDEHPHRIALRKGTIVSGLPAGAPNPVNTGLLRRSTATYAPSTWLQLRLDMIVNLNGDVLLKCFMSDTSLHDVDSPVWVPIPGIEDADRVAQFGAGIAFIDDALQVNSGSAPFTAGRMGFGFMSKDVTRRAFFDQIECFRQT